MAFCVFISAATHAKDEGHDGKSIEAGLTDLLSCMMPKYVIMSDDLPRLPSRKIDRNVLKKIVGEMDATALQKCFL
ncbi:hypothetical protein AUEXF2481DRAFT_39840 [Aureobasidium subglaciale EXF-2481]|uniref:AMP-binding enzyme C-terminal domain-containing protein n=1 Tax=Aureobasidium subglaciale (strain EXF-2481) TaxID=1043005 RepID=A0A074YMF7_AURSE|nr:uncharacterized protein AUEXF2481DRAFT_39840 [Aureobasidium subglaciale EXF-2481]KEQ95292.1 hypothetical protein AUEXF2481DRAFT_39840 [Aureobasidium subglaciale EXF-2481]